MEQDRVRELESKVSELSAQLERLTALLAREERDGDRRDGNATAERGSRRQMLKLAGAAAAGAVASTAVLGAQPAAAANGDPMLHGSINTTENQASAVTRLQTTATGGGAGYLFQTGTAFAPANSAFPCALAGWSTTEGFPNGVYGYTGTTAPGYGLVGQGSGPGSSGARLGGVHANLVLAPSGAAAPARSGARSTGEIVMDGAGSLWVCVSGGTPGSWRKLAGPATAGAFHPISPVRVYDSRLPDPAPGTLANGESRVVSVKDGRNEGTGAVDAADAVPDGAIAVAGNLTIVETSGAGFLSVMPGDAATRVGSTINWSANGQIVANGFVSRVDGSRQVKVFAGGGTTHFVIDITGYYR